MSSNGCYIFDNIIGKGVKQQLNSGDILYLLHKDKMKGKCEDVGFVFSPIIIIEEKSEAIAVVIEDDSLPEVAGVNSNDSQPLPAVVTVTESAESNSEAINS